MNTSTFQKITLRIIVAVCLAAGLFSLGVSARAKPETAVTAPIIDAFQQVRAGQGWLLFGGRLYWTNNDGAAWMDITPSSASIQAVTFLDAARGWTVLSDVSGYALASTTDGGVNWQTRALDLSALAQADAPIAKVFMGWRTDAHGWLVFKLATGSNFSRGVLFLTTDGGATWQSREIPLGEPVTFVNEMEGWVAGGPAGNQFFRTRDGGLTWQADRNGDPLPVQNEAGIVAESMSTSTSGWAKWESGECSGGNCAREARLLTTRDGVRWESLRLPDGQTSLRENFSVAVKSLLFADTDTKAYMGQGFDMCEIRNLTQMQTWWNSSPYSAVNLYFGGISRACSNSLITSSYLSQLNAQGWRFIPTWVGLQAACTGYSHKMNSNPAISYTEGVAEADAAIAAAQSLGLTEADGSGTVIYFDLEAYDTSNASCRAAANAFINGWTFEMRAKGNLAGVYGAACASAPSDWWTLANVPDALWVAHWVEGSYSRTASVFGTVCLDNNLWPTHQRLRQYAGDHDETWGGLTLNIDSNVLDGPLTVPNGTGDASAPGTPSNPDPANGSTLERTNDTWLSWKTDGDTCSVHIWGGSLDTTIPTNCSLYHLGVQGGGAYSWQVTAANGFGSTAGPTWHFNLKPSAPSGLTAAPASSTRVNLNWALSSDEPAVDNYLVYVDGVQAGSVAGGVRSYQTQNLMCASSHSFYVKAVRQGVQSNASNTASATTGSCAPVLIAPLGGLLVNSLQPTFLWQAVEGANFYQIQVSANPAFSSYSVNTRTSANSYTHSVLLVASRLYYWRVRAVGSFGYSDWASSSFTTPNPPGAPSLVAPAINGLIYDYTPVFDWKDVAVPAGTLFDHYQIQVAASAAFTTLLHDEAVTVSEFTPLTGFPPNTRNYWRVRAVNTLGHVGPWSAVWNFRAALLPPNPVSPADAAFLLHRRPTFDWSDVNGASGYTLQISTAANFSSLLKSASPVASTYSMPTDLPANATLYWRVRTNGANGPSLWSSAWTFHTANPPSIPALTSPLNSALIKDLTPRLAWRVVTVPAATTFDHYQVQVATDAGFASLVLDGTVAAVSPSEFTLVAPLLPSAKYYWRVRAFNTSGEYSAWSVVWFFRTTATATALPDVTGTMID